jgi:hypothetical protein
VKAPPKAPTGYRSTRRASKAAKLAKRAERQHELATGFGRVSRAVKNVGYVLGLSVGTLLVGMLVLLLVASGINWLARLNAGRGASATVESEAERKIRENLLVVGEQNGEAVGFLALRVASADKHIYGIAIPDGAFIEIPGQGFGKIGDAYPAGPRTALAAISNYLTVQFRSYVVVPAATYQDAIKRQSIDKILSAETTGNVSIADKQKLREAISSVPREATAIVPMPVKPVQMGSETYFQPQKLQVGDLLAKWWGVDASKAQQTTRVILYNGAGKPGIAGDAAEQLIRAGLRVVDTKNADRFDYPTTAIVVKRGSTAQGTEIQKILGVGVVKNEPGEQTVADVIVIVGRDYPAPPKKKVEGKK